MLIGEIYDKIFAETKEMAKNDHELSDEIAGLLKNVDPASLSHDEFTELICRACAVGERQGFVSGFRVFGKIICEALT